MTREETIRLGMELRRLVKSESFVTAVELLKKDYASRFFMSDYGSQQVREEVYRRSAALDDLISTFNWLIAIAEQDALVAELEHN